MRRSLFAAGTMLLACSATPPRTIDEAAKATLQADGRIVVVTFFSASCGCQRAHDARLVELERRYEPRGVKFVIVDVEPGATDAETDAEASSRGYLQPILRDSGALADALGAEYATYTVVLDGAGVVRYTGGIDSDRIELTSSARPFVQDALDDLLAGHEPRVAEGKTLGCVLRRR